MEKLWEGSRAIAETIKMCRPKVISAYPITPQTHIVESLSQLAADGDLVAEFINVESEHSAASVVLGASATGARTYTATTSQGLLLMLEVLYNIAGMRLPVVMTCANRAVSAPLSIWNDQQDSFTARDSGWIQLYAEDSQEACDLHLMAYRIAEDKRIMLPVMVCLDGFFISHTFEPVEPFEEENVKQFLPDYQPLHYLTPKNPLTFGSFAEPDKYTEARYIIHRTLEESKMVIRETAEDFKKVFGRGGGDLVEDYFLEDADFAFVAMGSIIGSLKDLVDKLREKGEKVGILKIISFRPFPGKEITTALEGIEKIAVLEKAVSLGSGGILVKEVKESFYGRKKTPQINGFIVGLGGRDIPQDSLENIYREFHQGSGDASFVDLNYELLGGK